MMERDVGALLGAGEPEPVLRFNPRGNSPFLLIGDHAGAAIPRALGNLGVSEEDLARHIAWDIGVRGVGEALALALNAAFIHQAYSRLVIDCNRDPTAPEAVPTCSDGTSVPGNEGLSEAQRDSRVSEIHAPYQAAIAEEIERRAAGGLPTVLVSLHSFTPAMDGFARPWDIGILHDGANDRFAKALLARLCAEERLVVGDNEPYRMDATDYTIPRHAFAAALPYVEIEIRQDLIGTAQGQRAWSDLLGLALPDAYKL